MLLSVQLRTDRRCPNLSLYNCSFKRDEVSHCETAVVAYLREHFGDDQVHITFGYQTKYKRIQVLGLPKSHTNDAVAIACKIGEKVKLSESISLIRCLPRGKYQRFNGPRSEHKCWSPRKVHGFKLYELVKAKGKISDIAGRRENGAFVIKDLMSGKKLLEMVLRKVERIARPTHGWMIMQKPSLE